MKSIIIILFFLKFIEINFYKNVNYNFKSYFEKSNSFWNYVNILNESNNSVLFFLFIFNLLVLIFKIEINNKNNFMFIIWFFTICYFNVLQKKIKYFVKKKFFLNFNLINGVVLIHPIFIYITYSVIILLILVFKNKKKINFFIFNFKKKLKLIFLFSFIALYLGGYWAQQELNWGGWWNWDFVEIIALIFFLLCVSLIHLKIHKNYNLISDFNCNSIFYIILFYFLVRLDVLNSIHSFNSFIVTKTYFNYIILISLIILIYLMFFKTLNKLKFNKFNKNWITIFFKLIISIYIYYIICNIFYSFYKNIQFIEITKYLKNLNLVSFLVILLYITKIKNTFNLLILLILIKLKFYFFIFIYTYFYIYYIIYNKYKNINILKRINDIIYHLFFLKFIIYIIIKNYSYINNKLFFFENLNNEYLNNFLILSVYKNEFLYNLYNLNTLKNYFYFNKNNFYSLYYQEILIDNILLKNNNLFIIYNIDNFLILNFFNIYLFKFAIVIILLYNSFLIFFIKINKKIKNNLIIRQNSLIFF